MSENTIHFDGFSLFDPNFRVEITLDSFSDRFQKAQQWLGDRVLEDSRAVMPHLTGNLQQRSSVVTGGARVVFPAPAARFLYFGKVMVDPDTGSPWAKKDAKKVVTERDLKYSDPNATAKWFEAAKQRHLKDWIDGAEKILKG